MFSILINAYACSPNMGSEPGMAWNWCVNLANHCELYIITEGEFRDKIETTLSTLPQGKNMHFYYNPVSDKIRKMCWNQGDWRFYRYYKKWQYKTYRIALDIVKHKKIDIIHQLNMIGFREPGYLWKIPNIPFIWGPVDAKEKFPVAYLGTLSLKQQLFVRLKNFITKLQFIYSKRVKQAVNHASKVISASSESVKSFNKYFNINSPLINETGCYYIHNNTKQVDKINTKTFDILWVGKSDARKQLILAIKTIAQLHITDVILHIVGIGEQESYVNIASSLNIADKCVWYGQIKHEDVQNLMQQSDILFFTSIAEGTPHVVLEAIGNNLPVVCFDCCGQGDSVNEKVGIKIKLSEPNRSIKEFVEKIEYLYHNKDILKQLSQNCTQRQEELSWENKAKQMIELYNQAIKNRKYYPD
jgi:glycosyltransferase involved in cell wall biosynthesis